MEIAIIGAGLTGLTAAYDLLKAGHDVTIYEASEKVGGLAAGFKEPEWDWHLEHFYHHIFETDKDIIGLVEELGIRDTLFFPKPLSSVYYQGEIYPFDSIPAFFKYPAFNLFDTLRFGGVTAILRYTNMWRRLEKISAEKWMLRWYGRKVYDVSWKPILINKFGRYYNQVPMSWMWARLAARSFRLGYFKGGFQTLADALHREVIEHGAQLFLNRPVAEVKTESGRIAVTSANQTHQFDKVLSTVSPDLTLKIVPELAAEHPQYAAMLQNLESIGAVVLVVALKRSLLEGTYWLNLPATDVDKSKNEVPFLALVEHTNYIDRAHYGDDIILYIGDYVPADHPYFQYDQTEIEDRFLSHLTKFNSEFKREWVKKCWLFRAKYAQPVPFINHSQHIPPLQSPMNGLFVANMSQVYPWDRGTNFAVELGRRVGKIIDTK